MPRPPNTPDAYAGELLAFRDFCERRELNFAAEIVGLIRMRMAGHLTPLPIDRPLFKAISPLPDESAEAHERRLARMRDYSRRRHETQRAAEQAGTQPSPQGASV